MSKPDNKPRQKPTGPDGGVTYEPFTLTGMVRTKRNGKTHYALAMATFTAEGVHTGLTIGLGQEYPFGKEPIAKEHVRVATALASKL